MVRRRSKGEPRFTLPHLDQRTRVGLASRHAALRPCIEPSSPQDDLIEKRHLVNDLAVEHRSNFFVTFGNGIQFCFLITIT